MKIKGCLFSDIYDTSMLEFTLLLLTILLWRSSIFCRESYLRLIVENCIEDWKDIQVHSLTLWQIRYISSSRKFLHEIMKYFYINLIKIPRIIINHLNHYSKKLSSFDSKNIQIRFLLRGQSKRITILLPLIRLEIREDKLQGYGILKPHECFIDVTIARPSRWEQKDRS